MNLQRAVSAAPLPEEEPYVYCLLSPGARTAYVCVETALALSSDDVDVRVSAYWHHYKTHVDLYQRWASRRGFFDPTLKIGDSREEWAEELVRQVLLSFRDQIEKGAYDRQFGPPCKYVKRSIRHRHIDLMRKGPSVTAEACRLCYEQHQEFCPACGAEMPWEDDTFRQCHHYPAISAFDPEMAAFALVGIQEGWPPILYGPDETPPIHRPVEDRALTAVMVACLELVMQRVLSQDQHVVLLETYLHQKSSREIGLLLGKSPANVDQMRRRAIQRLQRALRR